MSIKTFLLEKGIDYQEVLLQDEVVHKMYMVGSGTATVTSVPDGCVDLEFVKEDGKDKVYICGSFTSGTVSPVNQYESCFGIKLNPGYVPEIVQDQAERLVDNRIEVSDDPLFRDLMNRLSETGDFAGKVHLVRQYLGVWGLSSTRNHMAGYVMDKIRESSGHLSVAELTDNMGYSQKYVDRVFRTVIGMSMKRYAVIVRAQEAIDRVVEGREDEVYDTLGYYDQAHFIREFKRHTLITPHKLVKNREYYSVV